MKSYLSHIFSIAAVLLINSCTEKLDPAPLDYTQIISGKVSKTWSLKSLSFRNTGDPDWKLSEACWSDDSYTFNRDTERKYEFKSGSVKCDALEEKITIIDTWSFVNASSTLYFIVPLFSDNALPFTVSDIDNNDMVLELFFNDAGTQSYQLKFELKEEK